MSSLKNLRDIAHGNAQPEQLDIENQTGVNPPRSVTAKQQPRAKKAPATEETVTAKPTTRTARPMGKSRNPEFTQIGAYIRKKTKKAAELRLMQEEGEQDLSDLIETLLVNWLSG